MGDTLEFGPKRPFPHFVAADRDALARDVGALARRYGLPTAVSVEDLVQHAYARLQPKYDARPTERAAHEYAVASAENALYDAWRKAIRRDNNIWRDAVRRYYTRQPEQPDEAILRRETVAHVRSALCKLPPAQLQAIYLVELKELPPKDAAQVMGVPPATMTNLLRSGRRRLRRILTAPAILLGWCARVRRTARPAFATAFTVASQAALLGLVLTTPLTVLPDDARPLADAIHGRRSAATANVPTPTVVSFVGESMVKPLGAAASRPLGPVTQSVSRLTTTAVTPPTVVCLRTRACDGERITLTVFGVSQSATQRFIKVCPVVPDQTEPYVTCREGGNAP